MKPDQTSTKRRAVNVQHVAAAAGDEQKKKEAKEREEQRVAKALEKFDRMPAAAGVGASVVAALCNCAVSTVWVRAARNPDFPKPRKIGGRARWNVGELRKLLQGEPA
ncbi:hypothetical protein PQQ96_23970 [Paraburkholderia sediminicola]|uniref:helix-turn-helix transcriptional regulator n=1 Tax=Paraburkholderia sediminicola TaxID=458836 RepID=UPI0038BBE49D